jgi:inosine-uridine nucleoside N-ribohydrolase
VDECLAARLPITMFGLNLTRQVRMGEPERDRLEDAGTETARTVADLLGYYERHGTPDRLGQPMHDPCAVLGLTHPHLFSFEPAHMVVTTTGEDRGRTKVTSSAGEATQPITLAVSAAAEAVVELILAAAENPLETDE